MDRSKCIESMSKYLVLHVLNRYECTTNSNRLHNLQLNEVQYENRQQRLNRKTYICQ